MTSNIKEAYKICESPGRGMGFFANRLIKRGELIISEKPLVTLTNGFVIANTLEQRIEKLSQAEKDLFYSLSNSWPSISPRCMGIFKTNALPLGVDSPTGAIFPIIARSNHSCLPNANHYWNESKGLETIFALKDIENNEEITLSYCDSYTDKQARQAQLKEGFIFDCKCEICSIEDKIAQKRSDIRRNILKQLDAEIPELAPYQPVKALDKIYTMQNLMKEEGLEYDALKQGSFHTMFLFFLL